MFRVTVLVLSSSIYVLFVNVVSIDIVKYSMDQTKLCTFDGLYQSAVMITCDWVSSKAVKGNMTCRWNVL